MFLVEEFPEVYVKLSQLWAWLLSLKYRRKLFRLRREVSVGFVAEDVTFSACFSDGEIDKIEA